MSNDTPVTQECPRTRALMDELSRFGYSAANERATTLCWELEREIASLRASAAKAGEGWQPIETAPKHKEVLLYREDAGVMFGIFTSIDQFTSEQDWDRVAAEVGDAFEEDVWWLWCFDGAERVEGNEIPTHWQPLPAPPSAAPGEVKCPGCGKRFPSECDWCSEQIPRPDCAPSPEQQGAEQREDVREILRRACSWFDIARVAYADKKRDSDRNSLGAKAASIHGSMQRWLRTAPAPALGFTADEIDALENAIRAFEQETNETEDLNSDDLLGDPLEMAWRAEIEDSRKMIATLRSMLERGGR
jgi:hypothetical protein